MRDEYWTEAISIALDDIGMFDKFTKEQIEFLGGALSGSHENYGLAHGYDCIPNPRDADVDSLKQKRKQDEKEFEETRERYFKALCRAHKISPDRVWFNERDGVLEYRR